MYRRARPHGLAEGLGVQLACPGGDGLFTNHKFCLTREARLALSWSRAPLRARRLRSRAAVAVSEGSCPLGAGHERTALDGGAESSRPPGGGTAVGSGLPTAPLGAPRGPPRPPGGHPRGGTRGG